MIVHPQPQNQLIAPQFDEQVREQLAALLCGPGTDPADCPAVDTGGYKVVTTLDTTMQDSAEKWLKAYILAPNLGSKQATIDYLAQLGITAQVGPVRLLPDRRAEPDDRRRHRFAQRQHPQRGPDRRRLPNGRGARLRRQRRVLRDRPCRTRRGRARTCSIRSSTSLEQRLPPAGLLVQADQLHRRSPGRDHDGRVAVHGRGHQLRRRLHAPRRRQLRARSGPHARGAPVLAQHPGRQGRLDQRRRPPDAASGGLRAARSPPNSNPGVSIGIGTLEVHPADLVSAYGAIADGGNPGPALDDPVRHGLEGQRRLVAAGTIRRPRPIRRRRRPPTS